MHTDMVKHPGASIPKPGGHSLQPVKNRETVLLRVYIRSDSDTGIHWQNFHLLERKKAQGVNLSPLSIPGLR